MQTALTAPGSVRRAEVEKQEDQRECTAFFRLKAMQCSANSTCIGLIRADETACGPVTVQEADRWRHDGATESGRTGA
jgi:hypothetical protein